MISPEALEKARAITHMFCLFPPSDKQALEIQIAAALQAERDAAAPKLPDDLAGLVAELRDAAALKKEAADVVRPFAENAPPGNGEGSFELPDSHPITFRSDAPDTPSIIVGHFRAARSFLDKWEGRDV